ncbi:SMI1/KNR4 family protein [Fodinicola acaciae]|uniref:SMI1/KNR4 family protein n=1 Tax=Fodinicola acaciae TaxID=2681555 RepID=UPI0013D7C0A2|nr:SMI1/KNR4 family protein [Fodinicola acaciae]
MTRLEQLISRGRSPLGPPVSVDLGAGLYGELATLLAHTNGFTVFNAGVQLFHLGERGLGPELRNWNADQTWRHAYGSLTDGLFFFAQDLFGVQFAIEDNSRVCTFDPETGEREVFGGSLEDWADWLLADPDERGAYSFATHWQDTHGALDHDQRLLPRTLFVLGGSYDDDNLVAEDAVTCMLVRGPIASQIHDLPDGATIRFDAG